MKFTPLLALLCACAATAMMFCCFFGGYSTSTLSNVYMISFNVSELSSTKLENTTDGPSPSLSFQNGRIAFSVSKTRRDNEYSVDSTRSLNLSQYYAVYILNYCEGEYFPDYHDSDASPALTHCSKVSLTRHFDLISIVDNALSELLKAMSLKYDSDELKWPDGMYNSFAYFKSAQTAMVVLGVAGTALALLLIVVALLAICVNRRWTRMLLFVVSMLALCSLGAAAGLSTAMINSVVNAFNSFGDQVGISAQQGNWYLGCTWSAVAMLFMCTLTVTARVCMPDQERSHGRRRPMRTSHHDYAMMSAMHDPWYAARSRDQFRRLCEEEEEDFR